MRKIPKFLNSWIYNFQKHRFQDAKFFREKFSPAKNIFA